MPLNDEHKFYSLAKPPTDYIGVIGKWIVLPVVVFVLINLEVDRYECRNVCEEEKFVDYKFKPNGRAEPKSCHCLTQENIEFRTQGTKVRVDWKLLD